MLQTINYFVYSLTTSKLQFFALQPLKKNADKHSFFFGKVTFMVLIASNMQRYNIIKCKTNIKVSNMGSVGREKNDPKSQSNKKKKLTTFTVFTFFPAHIKRAPKKKIRNTNCVINSI